jgi:pimeloyl-ACP methyl ester carboxylesterase
MKKGFLINALTGLLVVSAALTTAHAGQGVTCRWAGAPAAITSGEPANYTVSGELCATDYELIAGAPVQLLIHGATYNHNYWDFGKVDGIEYSYARDVAAHGYPTFAIDQLGSGNSSHPQSGHLTLQAASGIVHQIVQALRNGAIADVQFGEVVIVGHSPGSVVAREEALTYGEVDGVIVTGGSPRRHGRAP